MHELLEKARDALKVGDSQDSGGQNWQQVWDNIGIKEQQCAGSSPTGDEEFDRLGYKIVRNFCPVELLVTSVPDVRGQLNYENEDISKFIHHTIESQVPGSVSRYKHPFYYKAYTYVKHKLEKEIGQPLYKTYYYDRFYFPGQDLKYHNDRDSCEISISIHCGSNLKDKWPMFIKSPDGSVGQANLKPGDAIIYKGCERPHWRLPMPGVKRQKVRNLLGMSELYYHQMFMHFVLANGIRAHFSGDSNKNNWQ